MPLRVSFGIAGFFWLTLASLVAAAPTITNTSLRGLQVGGVTTLTLQGRELSGELKLLAPFAIAKQEVLAGGNAQQVQLAVTLDNNVAPGIYAVRVAGPTGISSPLVLGVDRLPQQPMTEQIATLPAALTGALGGGQILKATFTGQKDQPLVVDVEANRLGANFKPVVRVYDSRGKQLAYSPPLPSLAGAARLAVKLPADDTYTIELLDLVYRAGVPGYFRLKVGALSYADFVIPQAVTRGTKGTVQFGGSSLPANTSAEVDATSQAFRIERPSAAPTVEWFTGGQPGLLVSEATEAVEMPVSDGQRLTLAAIPCGVTGHISAKGEEDQYVLPVVAGQKLRIDVIARRNGSSLDGVLFVRGPNGNELARSDDQPGTADPGLEFTVPAGVDKLLLGVRDLESRSGPEYFYRLAVHDALAPDLSATMGFDTVNIPAGSTVTLPILLARRNYNGPSRIEVQGLVGDVQLAGTEIPAGASMALLSLTAKSEQPVHSVIQLVVRATEPNVDLVRLVQTPAISAAARYQPWMQYDIGLAIQKAGPIAIAWNDTAEPPTAFQGDKLPLSVVVKRGDGVQGDVRLKLFSSQPMPKKKVKQDNRDVEVDDTDHALRLEGTPLLKADASETTVSLLVPGDLPVQTWNYVVLAELLSPDGKTVITTTSTPVRALTAAAPFAWELTSSPQAEGRAGQGEHGNFAGKLTRHAGFQQPVVITLAGLPAEVKGVPQVTVAADQSEFTLPLTFEFGSKPGDYKNVQLTATVNGSTVPSAAAKVDVKIVPGEMPP